MKIINKTIFTGFAPNLSLKDVFTSLEYLLIPWMWPELISGENVAAAERKIESIFKVRSASIFDSGRTALYFALKSLGVAEGDEILVQSYTCMVVVNSIKWTGAKPIFVDIKDDLNMDAEDLEKKITPRSKILIIQHTLGLAADLKKLLAIAEKYDLKVIEDCAHSLGATYEKKLLGTFGDIGMLSFGSDKVLSSVRGGALITDDIGLMEKINAYKAGLPDPGLKVTFQHLLHSPIFFAGKKTYSICLGKILLALAKRLNLINKVIYPPEKKGEQVIFFPSKMPNSLAALLLAQLDDLLSLNGHRRLIADFYDKNLNNQLICKNWAKEKINKDNCIYLRYPILVDEPKGLMLYAKNKGIILGDWYDSVIAPKDIDLSRTDYVAGSCPNAEKLSNCSVNLPTGRWIKIEDAIRIVDLVNNYKK